MDVDQYVVAFRDRWWVIVSAGLAGLTAGLVYVFLAYSQYRAVSSVYLKVPVDEDPSVLLQLNGYMENQIYTYAELADKPLVQSGVIERLDLDVPATEMARIVSTEVPEDTYTLDIAVETADKQQSMDIANSTASALVEYVNSTEPKLRGVPMVEMVVTAPAVDATSELPASGVLPFGGLLLGLLGGTVLVLLSLSHNRRPADRSQHG